MFRVAAVDLWFRQDRLCLGGRRKQGWPRYVDRLEAALGEIDGGRPVLERFWLEEARFGRKVEVFGESGAGWRPLGPVKHLQLKGRRDASPCRRLSPDETEHVKGVPSGGHRREAC